MTRELQDEGHAVGRRRTARLMHENGLVARQKRRFKRTTDSEHSWPVAPNLLDQVFEARGPDEKWGGRYLLHLDQGRLAVFVGSDGSVLSSHRRLDHQRPPAPRPGSVGSQKGARHAPAGGRSDPSLDRGSQYCAVHYQGELRRNGIRISMSGKGNCYDNAMVETFFKTLKSELVWRTRFQTRHDAEQAIARYIDGFYNPVRRHSALDYQSPVQFENRALR